MKTKQALVETPPCYVCGKTTIVVMTTEQFKALKEDGKHIQDIFPDMPAELREMLITGTHPKCWDAIFSDSEEDEDDSYTDTGAG